jgi:hypothetical protein
MVNKLSKIGKVLFRGSAACVLVPMVAMLAAGIYDEMAPGEGTRALFFVAVACVSFPIGVIAIVAGAVLRFVAHRRP